MLKAMLVLVLLPVVLFSIANSNHIKQNGDNGEHTSLRMLPVAFQVRDSTVAKTASSDQHQPDNYVRSSGGGTDRLVLRVNEGLLIVGLAGVIAAFCTLRNVKISSERQLRAYVFADSLDLYDGTSLIPPREDKRNFPGVSVMFKNTGQTPAYRVVNWMDIAVISPSDESVKLSVPQLRPIHEMTMGSEGSFNRVKWFDRILSDQEIEDIRGGLRAIYVYGRVEYRDIFGREHFTNYRLHYTNSIYPPVGKSGAFTFSESGNDAN